MGALKAQLIRGGRESCAAVALRALFHIQPQHRENATPYNFIKAAAGRTRRRDVFSNSEDVCEIKRMSKDGLYKRQPHDSCRDEG